jgi:hypothetical protein
MKALYRILAAAVAIVATAGIAYAQAPSNIVNSLEVKQLVAANTPEANASLAKHFTALAEAYTADAAQHRAMARAYVGNPNHSLGNNVSAHCTKLAELATESATAAREMATYHEQLAAGVTATVPKGAAAFHAGAGAPAPTQEQLHQLASAARTPADHRALEEYFLTLAKQDTADAKEHAATAETYRVSGQRRGAEIAAMHCDRLAKLSRDAAKEATAAASAHHQLANVG